MNPSRTTAIVLLTALSFGGSVACSSDSAEPPAPSEPGLADTTTITTATAPTSAQPSNQTSGAYSEAALTEVLDDTKAVVTLLNEFYGNAIDDYAPPDKLIFYVTGEGMLNEDASFGPEKPTCGTAEIDEKNAFYCPPDNTVIASLDFLLDEQNKIGDAFTYVLFAHEYGHSAQQAVGYEPRAEFDMTELQADCYAGNFIQAEVEDGRLTIEAGDEGEFNASIAAIADEYGSEEGKSGDHGTLAQRATAFEFGRNASGASQCQSEYA